ncbi:preprotein translocase subunit Sec61beta [Candidatus Woesearchaeota archaeon]|nr:preprotein translocase subunit Sec61beta [Candidatus Woesearchaeota archaeon]
MADNRIQMPSSTGGLIRYFDDYKSKIELKPGHVILLIVLHWQGSAWLGI